MYKNNWSHTLFSALFITFFASLAFAETRLNVVGLFSGKALVSINGGVPQSIGLQKK